MDFSDYNSKREQKKCIDKDTFLFFKHLQRAAVWCEAVMQDSDHPLGAAFVNPGLAVAKDGYPPLTGCRFRSSSDLTEWSACPTREVVPRIFRLLDLVFPNRGGVFLFTKSATNGFSVQGCLALSSLYI